MLQVVLTALAVVVGYVLGVYHTRRSYRDALRRLRSGQGLPMKRS